MLLLRGTCIVNEAMLSGESTPLLKESVELREGTDRLDMNGSDRNNVVFSGTKALQVTSSDGGDIRSKLESSRSFTKPDLILYLFPKRLIRGVLRSFFEPASVLLRVNSFEL